MIKFEWDTIKAASNQKKHGVSFEEAQSVFYDEFAVQFFNEDSSQAEDRFLMLGFSDEARLLIVCHCERDQGKQHYQNHLSKKSHKKRRKILSRN
ncbi:MAG: BrnT family toxin [Methylotenera sp.]|uniref:BrnT family toxin n=1 Tax=Methylotenera sp. TaxID=2051956 RepID=UPI002486D7B0|nr:BrnT family toxin [Methylotenera sp.]MDI1307999.1 BrnT family toxin [Methylotenera sp.]